MAITIIVVPEKNMVVAELKGTSEDAYKAVIKKLDHIFHGDTLRGVCAMPNSFRVKVVPLHGDVYDEKEGIKIAKEKVLRNYYKSKDKALRRAWDYLILSTASLYSEPWYSEPWNSELLNWEY